MIWIIIAIILGAVVFSFLMTYFLTIRQNILISDNEIDLATYDESKQIMTINYKSGRTDKFKGDGTVWYTYPLMKRCGSLREGTLSDIQEYIKEHGNPYPIAHEIK